MKKYYFLFFIGLFFFPISPIVAQEVPVGNANSYLNMNHERALIPGNTMGEKLESLLFWTESEKKRRFPEMQHIFPSIAVKKGKRVANLKSGKTIIPQWDNPKMTVESYLKENNVSGLMVLQNDKIVLEVYDGASGQNTLWTSFSMAKSVTSMLLGVALKEGTIHSLDDPLEVYIPELKGADYGKVTVRQLLTMTSGIDWNEDYSDPNSDVAQMYLQPCQGNEAHILSYMKKLKSIHQPGTFWNYSTGETDLLGILIQKATGKNLSEYLSEKIWQPYGMATQAYWLADECSGLNIGGSGLSATLRDFARLGTIMLHKGHTKNGNLFAQEWWDGAVKMIQQTDAGGGYGYLWWVNPDGSFQAVGIFGQMIYVNPEKKLVIAQTAAWDKATSIELTTRRSEMIKAVERAIH